MGEGIELICIAIMFVCTFAAMFLFPTLPVARSGKTRGAYDEELEKFCSERTSRGSLCEDCPKSDVCTGPDIQRTKKGNK